MEALAIRPHGPPSVEALSGDQLFPPSRPATKAGAWLARSLMLTGLEPIGAEQCLLNDADQYSLLKER